MDDPLDKENFHPAFRSPLVGKSTMTSNHELIPSALKKSYSSNTSLYNQWPPYPIIPSSSLAHPPSTIKENLVSYENKEENSSKVEQYRPFKKIGPVRKPLGDVTNKNPINVNSTEHYPLIKNYSRDGQNMGSIDPNDFELPTITSSPNLTKSDFVRVYPSSYHESGPLDNANNGEDSLNNNQYENKFLPPHHLQYNRHDLDDVSLQGQNDTEFNISDEDFYGLPKLTKSPHPPTSPSSTNSRSTYSPNPSASMDHEANRPPHHPKFVSIPTANENPNSSVHRHYRSTSRDRLYPSPPSNPVSYKGMSDYIPPHRRSVETILPTPPMSGGSTSHQRSQRNSISESNRWKEEHEWLQSRNKELVKSIEEMRKILERSKVDKELTIRELESQYANQISLVQQDLQQKLQQQNFLIDTKLMSGSKYATEIEKLKHQLSDLEKNLADVNREKQDLLMSNTKLEVDGRSKDAQLEKLNEDLKKILSEKDILYKDKVSLQTEIKEEQLKYAALNNLYDHQRKNGTPTSSSERYTEEEVQRILHQTKREHQKEIEVLLEKQFNDRKEEIKHIKEKLKQQASEKISQVKQRLNLAYEKATSELPSNRTPTSTTSANGCSEEERKKYESSLLNQVNALQEALKAERDLSQKQLEAVKIQIENDWQNKYEHQLEGAVQKVSRNLKVKFKQTWHEKLTQLKESWQVKKQELMLILQAKYESQLKELKMDFDDQKQELLKQIIQLKSRINSSSHQISGHRRKEVINDSTESSSFSLEDTSSLDASFSLSVDENFSTNMKTERSPSSSSMSTKNKSPRYHFLQQQF